jgi:hypothetical protein
LRNEDIRVDEERRVIGKGVLESVPTWEAISGERFLQKCYTLLSFTH